MSAGRGSLLGLCCFGITWLTAACSLLYQPSEQCEVDSDCIRLARSEPALKGSYCEEHACKLPVPTKVDCETNRDCMQQSHGDSVICREHQCLPLRSGVCRDVFNEDVLAVHDDIVVLGAFERLELLETGLRGGLASMKLAAIEMQDRLGGAVGSVVPAERRPYVIVVCDNTPGPTLDAALDHLTKGLKVPVAVTTLQPSELRAQWERLSSVDGIDTMFINAFASDSSLEVMQTGGRIWSLLGSPIDDLAPAYVELINRQLAKVTANPAHVLLITSEVTAMQDIASVIESQISINGTSVADARVEGRYRRVNVRSAAVGGTTDTSEVMSAVDELEPDVVIALGGVDIIDAAITRNEFRAPSERALNAGSEKYYVLSHHMANSPELLALVSGKGLATSVHQRLLGLNYAGAKDRRLYDVYLSGLWARYPEAAEGFENYYDAMHYAMLSIEGIARQRPTDEFGGSLASQGFRRLIDVDNGAQTFGLEPSSLPKIAYALNSTDLTISVTGTMGPPSFSTRTGTRHTDATVWCYRQGAVALDGGPQLQWTEGMVRYEPSTGKFDRDPDTCQQADQ